MTLSITYDGDPVRVVPAKIHNEMVVPDLAHGDHEPRLGDERPGEIAVALFYEAVDAGALLAPDGIEIYCYDIDDGTGAGGFVLAAFAANSPSRGVTCGWREVANIAPRRDDKRSTTDPGLVTDALEFFAYELNAALLGGERRPWDPAGLGGAECGYTAGGNGVSS